jgi:hypothetical protein
MAIPLRTALIVTLATSFSALLPGCVSSEQLAIDRAVREYDCPKSSIRIRFLNTVDSYDVYKVHACGRIATYACSETTSGCVKESDDRRER